MKFFTWKLNQTTFEPYLDGAGQPVKIYGLDALAQVCLLHLRGAALTLDLFNVNPRDAKQTLVELQDDLEDKLEFLKVGSIDLTFENSTLTLSATATIDGDEQPITTKLDL